MNNNLNYEQLLTVIDKPSFRSVTKQDILTIAKYFANVDPQTREKIISEIPNLVFDLRGIVDNLRQECETEINFQTKIASEAIKTLNHSLDSCDELLKRESLTEEQATMVISIIDKVTDKIAKIREDASEKIEKSGNRFRNGIMIVIGSVAGFFSGLAARYYFDNKQKSKNEEE